MTKVATFRWLCRLFVPLLFTVSCHRDVRREIIAFKGSDGQTWTMNPDGTNAHVFMPDIKGYGFKWSPNGRQVAFNLLSDQGMEIWVANSDGSEPYSVTAAYTDIGIQTWLNDYVLLIRIREDVMDRYGDVHYTLDLRNGAMQQYSESLERAISLSSENQWVTWNLHSGLTLHTLHQDPQKLFADFWIDSFSFDLSPSGQEIIVCKAHRTSDDMRPTGMYRWKIDDTIEPTLTYTLDPPCGPVRWSPDGEHIALLKNDGVLLILDAHTNKAKNEYTIGPLVTSSFTWSPKSDAILITRYYDESDPSSIELASVNIKTGTMTRLTDNDIDESSPQWVIIQ